MSDDLIKRLKHEAEGAEFSNRYASLCQEAADRIEELECTLERIYVLAEQVESRINDLGGYDKRFTLRKSLGDCLSEMKASQND